MSMRFITPLLMERERSERPNPLGDIKGIIMCDPAIVLDFGCHALPHRLR